MHESLPPSTARLTPLMYPEAGDAKNAIAFAVSSGVANRFDGTEFFMVSATALLEIPPIVALASIKDVNLSVSVNPGKILFTVIPCSATSNDKVFDHDATAPRMVFDTPNPGIGCFTEVEMILIMRP